MPRSRTFVGAHEPESRRQMLAAERDGGDDDACKLTRGGSHQGQRSTTQAVGGRPSRTQQAQSSDLLRLISGQHVPQWRGRNDVVMVRVRVNEGAHAAVVDGGHSM
jgi:hypothetical protein